MLTLKIAEKANLFLTKDGIYTFIGTSKSIICLEISKHYQDLFYILSSLPKHQINQEIQLIEFELKILLKVPFEPSLPNDHEYLKQLALISLSHHDYVYSKMCLEKCLDYEKDCQTLRELISISNNFEDAEKYLDLALSFYSHITDSYEIDWIVAVCWNNGIRLYSTNQNCFAKK